MPSLYPCLSLLFPSSYLKKIQLSFETVLITILLVVRWIKRYWTVFMSSWLTFWSEKRRRKKRPRERQRWLAYKSVFCHVEINTYSVGQHESTHTHFYRILQQNKQRNTSKSNISTDATLTPDQLGKSWWFVCYEILPQELTDRPQWGQSVTPSRQERVGRDKWEAPTRQNVRKQALSSASIKTGFVVLFDLKVSLLFARPGVSVHSL